MDAVRATRQPPQDAGLDVSRAAALLNITPEAVRKRVRRGSLHAYKVDGTWRVVLPAGQDTAPDMAQDTARPAARDSGMDAAQDAGYAALVEQLRGENAYLRARLEAAETERAEMRRLMLSAQIAAAPALPATVASEQPASAPDDVDVAPKPLRRWWRFWRLAG